MKPSEVPADVLRAAVAASTTWRAVIPLVGVTTSAGTAPAGLRNRCDELGIAYEHFLRERPSGTVPPSQVPEADLREAVQSSRSWRAVIGKLDLSSKSGSAGASLRRRCDALGISYRHFTAERHATDAEITQAFGRSHNWPEMLAALDYSAGSRSAKATTRSHLLRLGLDPTRLNLATLVPTTPPAPADPATYVRTAGSLIVAGALAVRGYRISWPLEPAPYDLVVDRDGTATKVQVKTTTYKQGNSYICGITKNTYAANSPHLRAHTAYRLEEIDRFGIVTGDLDVYVIPVEVVLGLGHIGMNRYQRFRIASMSIDS